MSVAHTETEDRDPPKPRPKPLNANHWAYRNPDDFVSYPRLPQLSYLQECRLIERAQQNDIDARNEYWIHHLRLTLSVVNRFRIPDAILEDAVQEGVIGIKRAIELFEIDRLNSFTTYAWLWISQSIQRFLSSHLYRAHIPDYLFRRFRKFRREIQTSVGLEDRAAILQKWAADNGRLYRSLQSIFPLVEALPLEWVDHEEHPSYTEEEGEAEETESVVQSCRAAVATLRDRDRLIIEKRFGLAGHRRMSLREIGDELHLTRERIRQLEFRALKRLKKRLQNVENAFAHWSDFERPRAPEEQE
jgi:RNA polymerase sigma factor (sigma-70 family)